MYIVIEQFPEWSFLRDDNGKVIEFNNAHDAMEAAAHECQKGYVLSQREYIKSQKWCVMPQRGTSLAHNQALQEIVPLVVRLTEKISHMEVTDCFRENFTHIIENNPEVTDLKSYINAFLSLAFAEVGRKYYDQFVIAINNYISQNQ